LLTAHEDAALRFVAGNPDIPRWIVAERFGIGTQRLSNLACCPLGQRYLKALHELHKLEGMDYEMLLHTPDAIASVVGAWAIKY
jgi:hypothetical protein